MIRLLLALILLPLAACAATPLAAPDHTKRIALSFDDVPRSPGAFFSPEERARRILEALRRSGVTQAAFFVNPGNLEQPFGGGGEQRIAAYVAAGHVIANHSYSHGNILQMTAEAYVADLDRAQAWLKGRPGLRPWFRYPFLQEGDSDPAKAAAVRQALAQRGLMNGYATADSVDWLMENLTLEAKAKGERMDMDALRAFYVRTIVSRADAAEAAAVAGLGRSPAHVILMHETDLAALFLEDAVQALRAHGWEIIPVDRAYADPISRTGGLPPQARATNPAPSMDQIARDFAGQVLHRTQSQ